MSRDREPGRVEVICTDRRAHDAVQLRVFPGWRGPGEHGAPGRAELVAWLHDGPVGATVRDGRGEHGYWRFSCHRCGRDTSLRKDSFLKAVTGLAGSGPVTDAPIMLDISDLPF